MDWQETKAFLAPCFPEEVCEEMELLYPGELREIRVRAGRPVVFRTQTRQTALSWTPGPREVETLAEALSGHSLYAREDETRQGYVTLRGGHRMGLCGRVHQHHMLRELSGIGSLCIRIAAAWPGCADPLIPLVLREGRVGSGMLLGAPGTGKTTLLRDLARQLASGRAARQVAVIDERGELAACAEGIPQLDVGAWTDVLDGCGKEQAVPWLLRSMAPEVIVTDELSGPSDVAAVRDALSAGVAVIASLHAASLQEVAGRPVVSQLLAARCFEWYALLHPEGGGRIAAVYDRAGSPVKLP